MKLLIVFILSINTAFAEVSCIWEQGSIIREEIAAFYSAYDDHREQNDKFKHCSVSCIIAGRCGVTGTFTLGLLKEIADIFTDGNSELDDMRANYQGLRLSTDGHREEACFDACQGYFPLFK